MKKISLFILKFFGLAVLSLVSFDTLLGQSAAEPVKLSLGTKYEISNLVKNYPLRLLLVFEKDYKPSKISLLGVSFNNKNQQNLIQAFSVELDSNPNDPNNQPALKIDLTEKNGQPNNPLLVSEKLEPGTYQLSVNFESLGADNKPLYKILTIELSLPAAKLQLPAAFIIRQEYSLVGTKNVGTPNLVLIENSGHQTGLQSILVKSISLADKDSESVNANLNFNSATPILPGELKEIAFTSTGDFPLGTNKGSIFIKSPQLAEPIIIPLEVRSYRHWSYIILAIIWGLIAGFGTRILAKKIIDKYNARQTVKAALDSIEKEKSRYLDEDFNRKVQSAIDIYNRLPSTV